MSKKSTNKVSQLIAVKLTLAILFEVSFPSVSYALTSGPSQPEVETFTPFSTSEMVDLSTGDFNYNIPLLDVEGYPINLSYNSGITMDQEASDVGLGWNLNIGALTRQVRGLPDDFKGDFVTREVKYKPNWSVGVGVGYGHEFVGKDDVSLGSMHIGQNIVYNNYTGLSIEPSFGGTISAGNKLKDGKTRRLGLGLSLRSTNTGLTVSPSINMNSDIESKYGKASYKASLSINSIQGLKALSLSSGFAREVQTCGSTESASSTAYSSTISFGYQTYTPYSNLPMKNLSFSAAWEAGGSFAAIDGTADANAYYSRQSLVNTSDISAAYGYLYEHEAQSKTDALMDFNREKDGTFSKYVPYLPITNHTYDIFSASGQGVGGTFRPFRGDLAYIKDKAVSSEPDLSFDLGLEFGGGNIAKFGLDAAVNVVQNNSGGWINENSAANKLKSKGTVTNKPNYEPIYFKEAGEKAVDSDPALYSAIGAASPVCIGLNESAKFSVYGTGRFEGSVSNPIPNNIRNTRQKRNQNFSYLTKGEYQNGALQGSTLFSEINLNAEAHHLAEITIHRPDGSRYIYGLPVYNTVQKDVSFNCSGSNTSAGLVNYTSKDIDVSKDNGNDRGKNNLVIKSSTDPYAHAYMLTAVVSPDYVDVDNNGPTPNDFGTYTIFSYGEKVGGYQWRAPYDADQAKYNEGLKTLNYDDMGNYSYGVKDIFYVDKIETKNFIAVFDMENRKDGYGVAGETGGLGAQTMKYVKSISLYSRPDYYVNGSVNLSAVPIKKVNFEYSYELCKGLKNSSPSHTPDPEAEPGVTNDYSSSGKLTLKKVYFTFQNSYKAKLNSYEFTYSSGNQNPNYDSEKYDRWGNYREPVSGLTNADFPYSEQDGSIADANASNWQLIKIGLPSGGDINIEYEADDYAYVQDQWATKMIRLVGVVTLAEIGNNDFNCTAAENNIVFTIPFEDLNTERTCLVFKKDNPSIPASEYFRGIDELYFRAMININQEASNNGFEYVSGYAKVIGVGNLTNPDYGYVNIELVNLGDSNTPRVVNAMSKAAIQFARLNTFQESYNQSGVAGGTFKEVLDFLVVPGLIVDLVNMLSGPNGTLYNKGIGRQIQPYRSFIKVNCPTGYKHGGNCRVKSLKINDNWNVMASGQVNAEYGQEFDYTTVEKGKVISSGVAAYEPQIGADENVLRKPIFYLTHALLAPDDEFYFETPFGESFYPAPRVTYSKVTVKNLAKPGVVSNATGRVVHEFYTTRDYPTKSYHTDIEPNSTMFEHKSSPINQLLKFNVKHYLTATQGYSVVLNDMDSKPKAQWVYQEGKTEPISGVEYFYKDDGSTNVNGVKTKGTTLVNTATVITKAGQIQQRLIGLDYDFVTDLRESSTDVSNYAVQINTYGVVLIVPVILPPVWFTAQNERTQFRSSVVTKVIQTYGLLEKTVAHDLGSKVTTENVAYDAETGEVLLSKVVNEFKDPLYNFNYPAHWAYDGMGPAYQNSGVEMKNVNISSIAGAKNYFIAGDEILLTDAGTVSKCWIKTVNTSSISIVNSTGSVITPSGNVTIKIIRSGRRNQQAISVGSIASTKNPVDFDGDGTNDVAFPILDERYGILNASAIELNNKWKTYCDCGVGGQENEYQSGVQGNYRLSKSYLYLTERNQTKFNKNSDIRNDGEYKEFQAFWTPNGGNDWRPPTNLGNGTKWTYTSEVTEYSPYGFELENRDALGRFSSAVYGYNNTLPLSISGNSKYRQSGFDNFEDYDFRECADDHFSFKKSLNVNSSVNQQQSHSGKRSLKVNAGQSIKLKKDLNNCTNGN